MKTPIFNRYIGIDYSGAQTPQDNLRGIRVYEVEFDSNPTEVSNPAAGSKRGSRYWSRKELAHWLVECFKDDVPTLVGIDHAFSFPMRYFETHHLEPDWDIFLDDFCAHWPTAEKHTYVDFVRHGSCGNGAARSGNARWRRECEEHVGAKSVFHFDVPGQVAKSTHAGLPWLHYLRRELEPRLHFWPFDGWDIPREKHAIAEIYPSLWNKDHPREERTPDQHDAFVTALWLQQCDLNQTLENFFHPRLNPYQSAMAQVEGWILGVE